MRELFEEWLRELNLERDVVSDEIDRLRRGIRRVIEEDAGLAVADNDPYKDTPWGACIHSRFRDEGCLACTKIYLQRILDGGKP